jgi:DNA-binding NtrC family response regulator
MNGSGILFVDDDRMILDMVREYLSEVGYRVEVVDNGVKALQMIKDHPFEIVFTDIKMPDIDGLELLSAVKEYRPETEVIIVTGHGSMESAIQAMKFGSYDYLQKPFKLNVLKIIIDRIVEEKKLKQERIVLRSRVKDRHRYGGLVGISPRMQEIYDVIDRMQAAAPHVLIEGESGTGKELTAHVIHRGGSRAQGPFVPGACQSLMKGIAPAGQTDKLRELIHSAGEGTLFLDDICDLPAEAQAQLAAIGRELREAERTGTRRPPQIIAATNRVVKEALAKGFLDQGLHALLSEAVIRMPPLRERKEDLCLLINHFLQQFNARSAKKVYSVAPDAMDYLFGYGWPGNVIQLENVIERAFALGVELVIEIGDLPAEIRTAGEISKMH